MAPKPDSAESIVLNYVNEQNRPLNSQNVADALQKYNLKKSAVQKALDALADSKKIAFKEYGKQKIYVAQQSQFEIPDADELNRMKDENSALQQQLSEQQKAISEVEAEIRALRSSLTLEEMQAKQEKLRTEVEDLEEKLSKLRKGVTLVNPEERKMIGDSYAQAISQWRKRKRIFREIWDAITENSSKDIKEFKEELGIEYDEDVGLSLQSYADLVPQGKRTK